MANFALTEPTFTKNYLRQSRVEIEDYFIAYFNRIAMFEAPYH